MIAVDLPEEVIREIVWRMPVKSLLKFRCVSKFWLSFISSHQFAMTHLNISSKKNNTLIFGSNDLLTGKVENVYTCSVSSVSELTTTDVVYSVDDGNSVYDELLDCLRTKIDSVGIWIVGSCNGLVCLSFTGGNDIILWNPATRECKKLPYTGTHFRGYFQGTSHGFGYDKVHDDYKVVEFSNSQVKVYSRRSNSWKVLGHWPGGDASHSPSQFLNGAIHWSVCISPDDLINVVAQDVVSDEFVELPLPNFEINYAHVIVEILDGCVALCCEYKTCIDVWVMKEYGLGESWIKQACIPCFPDLIHYFIQRPRPLLLFGDGKILISHGMTLSIYDSTDPQPQQISWRNMKTQQVTVTTYFESLVSPNLDEADVCAKVKQLRLSK